MDIDIDLLGMNDVTHARDYAVLSEDVTTGETAEEREELAALADALREESDAALAFANRLDELVRALKEAAEQQEEEDDEEEVEEDDFDDLDEDAEEEEVDEDEDEDDEV